MKQRIHLPKIALIIFILILIISLFLIINFTTWNKRIQKFEDAKSACSSQAEEDQCSLTIRNEPKTGTCKQHKDFGLLCVLNGRVKILT